MLSPIHHRSPSRALRCALLTPHGAVFRNPDDELKQEFIPHDELRNYFGYAESWLAHALLTHVAGCVGVVESD